MRIICDYISQSVTVSVRTEAMLMQIGEKYMFIEYPTHIPPIPENLNVRGNTITTLTKEHFDVLKECINRYTNIKHSKPFLHAPSFIVGFLEAKGIDACNDLNIM